tara:strand:+ start:566 stop:2920 length:2355 start_codon:yes stop_codon:yes gene_type:complete
MRIPSFLRLILTVAVFSISEVSGKDSESEYDPFSDEAQKAVEEALKAEEPQPVQYLEPGQVQKLNVLVEPSLVTIRQLGRDGESRGTGSGFIVSKDGLIVTNLHVIGEGRSIEVELTDGTIHPVIEVHASDRHYDLAVVRIDPGSTHLKPLKVADSDTIQQGELIVGFGAPQGLSFSVVAGVISAIRKLDPGFIGEGETPDYPMLQLAMPIEQGNSGGPILSLEGEVLGVVTLKHRVTKNLGFAVPSNDLTALLEKPNPVPISRWRTIGVIDSRQWTPIMGGDWTQRGGVITARQMGDGFGGRALCLSREKVPEVPYEISVQVRLNDESGASGLTFASDGKDKHYGFYPSGGKMRLTRFDGPDVYSWSILEQFEAPSYEPGEWNLLRVRVEEQAIIGWVNGEKVLELEDSGLRGGRVGLCKFRETEAEFRGFEIGKALGKESFPESERERLDEMISRITDGEDSAAIAMELSREGSHGRAMLLDKAEELVELAQRLREMEGSVHRQMVINELTALLDKPEKNVDLFEVGLQIARIDDPELDLDHYRNAFDRLVADARLYLDKHALEGSVREQSEALRNFLFKENGFHGSRTEYYHHANSYVNHVLDDREGLPITLSVVFVEMARRLRIPGVFGAPLPGKFMVGVKLGDEGSKKAFFIDVYESGKILSHSQVVREVWGMIGQAPKKETFEPAGSRDIAVRMLRNLVDIEINRRQMPAAAKDYIELLLAIEPNSAQERFQRALLRIQGKDMDGARSDLDWLLENQPPGIDYSRLESFRRTLPLQEE